MHKPLNSNNANHTFTKPENHTEKWHIVPPPSIQGSSQRLPFRQFEVEVSNAGNSPESSQKVVSRFGITTADVLVLGTTDSLISVVPRDILKFPPLLGLRGSYSAIFYKGFSGPSY